MKKLLVLCIIFSASCLYAIDYPDYYCRAGEKLKSLDTGVTVVLKDGWNSDTTFKVGNITYTFVVKVYGKPQKYVETFINEPVGDNGYKRALLGSFHIKSFEVVNALPIYFSNDTVEIYCGNNNFFSVEKLKEISKDMKEKTK
jgi:hypothetical protein